MEILLKKLDSAARLPAYATDAEPGMDLFALEPVAIEPGSSVVVKTGVAIAVPVGFVGQIVSQHSLALAERIKVTPDQVDSGYRGEVQIELTNTGDAVFQVNAGDVVAQLLIHAVHRAHLIEAEDLSGEVR